MVVAKVKAQSREIRNGVIAEVGTLQVPTMMHKESRAAIGVDDATTLLHRGAVLITLRPLQALVLT